MESFTRDLNIAIRQLLRTPGFTLTAVLMLALGIGATTAIFSIVEGVLLRPLPFPEPERLMAVGEILRGAGETGPNMVGGVTAPDVRNYTRRRIRSPAWAAIGRIASSSRGWVSRRPSLRGR